MLDRWFIWVVCAGAVTYVIYRLRKDNRRYRAMTAKRDELLRLRLQQMARVEVDGPYDEEPVAQGPWPDQWPDLGDAVLNDIFRIAEAAPDGVATGLIVDGNVVPIRGHRKSQLPQERS